VKGAALSGQGFMLTPTPIIIPELRSGALVPVLREFLPREFAIEALYPNRQHLPVKVRTFIDLLVKYFHQLGDPCQRARKISDNSGEPVVAVTEQRVAPKQLGSRMNVSA
jgi:hypothetical protein